MCFLHILRNIFVFFANFVQELYSVLTNLFHNVVFIALRESDTYVSNFRLFVHRNVKRILQSIQNQAIRVGSENDRNDFNQKDEIKYLWKKIVSFGISIQTN